MGMTIDDSPVLDTVLPFGKRHRGRTLGEILTLDRPYLEWLAGADFSDPRWPELARQALGAAALGPTRPTITGLDDRWVLVSGDPDDRDWMDQIRQSVDGRRWDTGRKGWRVPRVQIAQAVQALGGLDACDLDADVRLAYVTETLRRQQLDETRAKEDTQLEVPLLLDLFNYQRVGVEFWIRSGYRCLVADGVGLGKTLQAVAAASLTPGKTLVICPAAVRPNWRRQIERATGVEAAVWDTQKVKGDPAGKYHVTNFEAFVKRRPEFEALEPQFLVIDEAHYLSNPKAIRTVSVFGGTTAKRTQLPNGRTAERRTKLTPFRTERAMLLTATPINSHPRELFPLLHYLAPERYPDFWSYGHQYGAFAPGNLAGNPSTPRNLDQLHASTRDLVIRRTEEDIKSERPKSLEAELWLELTTPQRREYQKLLEGVMGEWAATGRPTLAAMHPLREWLLEVKRPYLEEILDQHFEAGRQVVVFATRIAPLKALAERYGDAAVLITGALSPNQRQALVDRMAAGDALLAAISIRAGGTGVDGLQQRCHTGFFYDLDWCETLHHQAKGRIDRTGQTEPVTMTTLLVEDTIELYQREVHQRKLSYTSQVADGEEQQLVRKRSVFRDFVQLLKRDYRQLQALPEAADTEGAIDGVHD